MAKDLPSFLVPKTVEHKVNDNTMNFRAISGRMAFKVKAVGPPLTKILLVLFQNKSSDSAKQVVTTPVFENGVLAAAKEETIYASTPVDVLKFRAEQMDRAVSQFWDVALSDEVRNVLAEIVIDSARDTFEGYSPAEFWDKVGLPAFPGLFMGVVKANEGVFGPLAQRLGDLKKVVETSFQEKLNQSLAASTGASRPATASPPPPPEPMPTPAEILGSSFKMSTPSSSVMDGPSNTFSTSTSSASEPSATPQSV